MTPDQNGKFIVTTENGNRIYSKKVVLATGAFTPFKKLLPDHHKQLDLTLMKESVLKVEVKQEDLHKLKTMPSVIYFTGKDARYDCYILPPICYDDNKYYIKIGHGASDSGKLINHQEVMQWYRDTGSDPVAPKLMKTLYNLMPGLKYTSGVVDHCVSTHTPSNHVMIDEISKGLTLLIGGCAHAAKSADEIGYEIGYLVALTILNDSWSYDIPKHEFTVYFKSSI